MSKIKNVYVCQECGFNSAKWVGKCPECHQWNSFLEETVVPTKTQPLHQGQSQNLKAMLLNEVTQLSSPRYMTNDLEFDRVLGGGITKDSLVLLGGEPGVGKSTLLLGVCAKLLEANKDLVILYVSGEESLSQISGRASRLNIKSSQFYLLHQTNLLFIKDEIKRLKPTFLIIDSIQTTYTPEVQSAPGTISQIRDVTYELLNLTKGNALTCLLIGHVTKDGQIAGPKILEHMVDTVIYFEGDQIGSLRILRSIKNRFGNTNEIGLFEMKENGLIPIVNPSHYFLEDSLEESYGRCLTCVMEGSRPLFIEVQALVVENKFGNGRRTTQGLDVNRLNMIVAIIDKYLEIPISYNDIYVNVVGGIKLKGPESDLAIMMCLLSSFWKLKVKPKSIFLGELGLTGEVRKINFAEQKIKELIRLDYNTLITHPSLKEYVKTNKLNFISIRQVQDIESKKEEIFN